MSRSRDTSDIFDPSSPIVIHSELVAGIISASAAAVSYTDSELGSIDLSSTIQTASAAAVSYLVDGAPGALNTLNELAAALNDDQNFATSILTTISSASASTLSAANLYTDNATPDLTPAIQAASAAAVAYTDQELANIDLTATIVTASAAAAAYTDTELSTIDLSSTIVTASTAAANYTNSYIHVGSASPTTPYSGQIWINTITASAPLLSVYGGGTWRMPGLGRIFSATGGNTVTTLGNYRVHTFTSSGTFQVDNATTATNIEMLLVGGGGGTSSYAGGGGGGEVVWVQSYTINPGSYPIVIGAGGVGEAGNGGFLNSRHGTQTTGLSQNALPGGGGKGSDDTVPTNNGTLTTVGNGGGGSSRSAGYSGAIGSFQGGASGIRYGGNRGGQTQSGGSSTNQGPNYPGAGGGGAGQSITADSGSTNGSTGGNGIANSINGTNYSWGAGGGGGTYYSGTGGSGGTGGGGAGSGGGGGGTGGSGGLNAGGNGSTGAGGNGGANTGGGGGGGRGETNASGGNGGSGIVIIRYLI